MAVSGYGASTLAADCLAGSHWVTLLYSAKAERTGFADAQAKAGLLSSNGDGHSTRQGSRECVIS